MAQKLYVKIKNDKGNVTYKEVHVLRSWQESDGRQIYLHQNGVYGYKDGSPVQSEADLDIIGDPTQRKLAQKWWDRAGKALAKRFYKEKEEELAKRQLQGLIPDEVGDTELDSAMYIRRPIKDKRRTAFSEPTTWPEFGFNARPDWWGSAGVIELGGYRYEMVEAEEDDESEEPKAPEPKETEKEQDSKREELGLPEVE